jgi:hypothetical protein
MLRFLSKHYNCKAELFSLLSLKKESEAYEINMLSDNPSVCLRVSHYLLYNQMVDFHKIQQ